ncbi:UNVERIFIED_CONTAM: hypothetical protein Sindi_1358900 [Sesamum indicum]
MTPQKSARPKEEGYHGERVVETQGYTRPEEKELKLGSSRKVCLARPGEGVERLTISLEKRLVWPPYGRECIPICLWREAKQLAQRHKTRRFIQLVQHLM